MNSIYLLGDVSLYNSIYLLGDGEQEQEGSSPISVKSEQETGP